MQNVQVSPVKAALSVIALGFIAYGFYLGLDGRILLGIGVGYVGGLLFLGLFFHGISAQRERQEQFAEQAFYRTEHPVMLPPPANGKAGDTRVPRSERLPIIKIDDHTDEN